MNGGLNIGDVSSENFFPDPFTSSREEHNVLDRHIRSREMSVKILESEETGPIVISLIVIGYHLVVKSGGLHICHSFRNEMIGSRIPVVLQTIS